MVKIEESRKLSLIEGEYRICSEPYVFYRLIANRSGVRLMTATASEDTGEYRAYEDQVSLVKTTARVFTDCSWDFVTKVDHVGRTYVETSVHPEAKELLQLATTVLDQMGFEDVSVLALREMKAIYDEFSVDDSGEDTYLSDGMWVTSNGRPIEK